MAATSTEAPLVVIFGASGQLGLELIADGLQRPAAYRLRAVVRNPQAFQTTLAERSLASERIEVVAAPAEVFSTPSADHLAAVEPLLHGCSYVVSALGAPAIFSESFVMSNFTGNVCLAIRSLAQQGHAAPRLLFCSSWGSGGNTEPHDGLLYRFFISWIIHQPLQDHHRSERIAEQHSADVHWMAVRPPGLSTGPRTTLPFVTRNAFSIPDVPHSIARADVARFFWDQIDLGQQSPHWNQPVAIACAQQS